MSEYFIEYDQLEAVGGDIATQASGLGEESPALEQSSSRLAQSQTLQSLGYATMARRSATSAQNLSDAVKTISQAVQEISSLTAKYEQQVIGALEQQVMGGGEFSKGSRSEARNAAEEIARKQQASESVGRDGSTTTPGATPQRELTPEEKREWTLDWLRTNRPELLEQIYDRLNNVATGAIGAGLVATTTEAAKDAAKDATKDATKAGAGSGSGGGSGAGGGGGSLPDAGKMLEDALGGGGSGGGGSAGGGGSDGGAGSTTGDDWVADLLNDAVDQEQLRQATEAVRDAMGITSDTLSDTGLRSLIGNTDVVIADANGNIFAKFGDQLIFLVQNYGMDVGIFASGAASIYAATPIAVEAVAHTAEYVTTKCLPQVNDALNQASIIAKFCGISLKSMVSGASGIGDTALAGGSMVGGILG